MSSLVLALVPLLSSPEHTCLLVLVICYLLSLYSKKYSFKLDIAKKHQLYKK